MIIAIASPTLMVSKEYYNDVVQKLEKHTTLDKELEVHLLQSSIDDALQFTVDECRRKGAEFEDLMYSIKYNITQVTEDFCDTYNSETNLANRFFLHLDFVSCVKLDSTGRLNIIDDEFDENFELCEVQEDKLYFVLYSYLAHMLQDKKFFNSIFRENIYLFIVTLHFVIAQIPFTSYLIKL